MIILPSSYKTAIISVLERIWHYLYIVTDRFNVQDKDIYVSTRMMKCIKKEVMKLSEKLFIERQMKHMVKKNVIKLVT